MTRTSDEVLRARVPARYRVVRPLGRGGQGSVYLVEDGARGGVQLALKAVAAGASGLGDIDAISAEFLTLSRLAHPGLARVRDFGRLDGGAGVYFTADFVAGRPLLEWAAAAPDGLESRVINVAAQALSVIAYLHRRGIEHGDVKPQNILVEESDGRPVLRVVDFGSARLRGSDLDDARVGTPAYMPPSGLGGPDVEGDGRASLDADLYGLGLSIFHVIVGHLPFTLGDRDSRREWHARGEPADLSQWCPDVSSRLDRLVRGLTSSRRGERFRDAAHASESLRGAVATTATRRGAPRLSPIVGRERVFSRLVESLTSMSPALTMVVGGSGSGKSALLDGVRAHLQVSGVHVIHFDGPSDPHAVASLMRLGGATDQVANSSSAGEDLAAEVVARLERPLVLLVDHADRGGWSSLLRALIGRGGSDRFGASRVATLVAGRDRDAIASDLELRGDGGVVELGPLDRDSLAVLASDYLGIESAPPRLLDALEAHSGGHPSSLRRVLAVIGSSGVRVDFLGELELPEDFESRVETALREQLADAGEELPEPLAQMALLLFIGRAPLTADEAAILYPCFDRAQWERGFDELRDLGLAIRRGSESPWRTGIAGEPSIAGITKRFTGADVRGLSRDVAAAATTRSANTWTSLRSPEVAACGARHLLLEKSPELACRWALRARRGYVENARGVEAFWLLAEAVRSPAKPVSGAWRCLARLRAADLAVALGRADEGLEILGPRGARVPPRLRGAVLERRARLLEQLGLRPEAVRDLEAYLRLSSGGRRSRGVASTAKRLECLARLTDLSFAEGAAEDGERYLNDARRLLSECEDDPPEATIHALSRLAGSEMDHGDAARAEALLERAVDLARDVERGDLAREPLGRLAVHLAGRGDRPRALALFTELEQIARGRGERLERLKALYNRALLELRDQSVDDAESHFREAVRLSEAMGRHPFSATVWLGLAGLLRETDRPLEALRLIARVVRRDSPARPNDRILAHNNRGEIYQELGRLDRSHRERSRAVRLAREFGSRFLLGVTLRNLGAVELALGDRDGARDRFVESLELASGATDSRWIGGARFWSAMSEPVLRDKLRALHAARRECRRRGDAIYAAACALHIAHLLLLDGRRRTVARCLGPALRAGGSGAPSRWRALASTIAFRAGVAGHERFETLEVELRRHEEEGRLFQVFVALGHLIQGLGPDDSQREGLVSWRELLAARLARRLDSDTKRVFRVFWFAASAQESTRMTPTSRLPVDDDATSTSALADAMVEWSERCVPEELEIATRDALADLCGRIGAIGVALVERTRSSMSLSVSVGRLGPGEGIGEELVGLIERVSREASRQPDESAEDVLVDERGIAASVGRARSRWIIARAPAGDWKTSDLERAQRRMRDTAARLSLAFRLSEMRSELDAERSRHRAAREEARRLHGFVQKAGALPETEAISRRSDLQAASVAKHASVDLGGETTDAPVAASRVLRELMSRIPRVASQSLPILILGESGVGKDMLARWIHFVSPRRDAPLLAEICSLPDSLLESELFGYVAGAFTDARDDRPGLFERVDGGTLYLDEVADLSPALQARLLRVLETRRSRRIGSAEEVELDFRLIAASRCASIDEVRASGLRDDLFWRLQGEVIRLPPLRERPEDIGELTRRFVASYATSRSIELPYISARTLERLTAHAWPGNVRELLNALRRALLEDSSELRPDLVLAADGASLPATSAGVEIGTSFRDARDSFEKEFVLRTLRHYGGNASRAAEALDITRRYLGKLLEKHGIDLKALKRDAGKAR